MYRGYFCPIYVIHYHYLYDIEVKKKKQTRETKKPQQLRIGGNWEEMYDAVDGTKTWYNVVTRKTTTKDPLC